MRLLQIAIVLLLGPCVGGCVWATYGTFHNDTSHEVQLSIFERSPGAEGLFQRITIPPHSERRCQINPCVLVDADSLDGSMHFQHMYLIPLGEEFTDEKGREFHFLLTERNVYPIPWGFRENWHARRNQIISAPVEWMICD